MKAALPQLRGAFALGFIFAGDDDLMIGARNGPPLAIGYRRRRDVSRLRRDCARRRSPTASAYLEDGDWVVLTRDGATICDKTNAIVRRDVIKHSASALLVDKANYRHFMAKEIHEQPEVVGHTLARYVDMATERVALPVKLPFDFKDIQRISITACGTASYAGYVAKYWFERFARLPVEVDVASEFRYREAPLRKGDLAIFISQSGETADTLAALRYAKAQGAAHARRRQRADLDDRARKRDRAADAGRPRDRRRLDQGLHLPTDGAGLRLLIAAGKARGELSDADEAKLVHGADRDSAPDGGGARHSNRRSRSWRAKSRRSRDVLYLGRGTSYPLALEGALKLKEISYIHAEGYAAGELKHGPIALIDENHAGHRDRAVSIGCSKRPSPTCRRSRRAAAGSS